MWLFKKKNKAKLEPPRIDKGFLVFESTSEVIQANNILKSKGFEVNVMGPPPHMQRGCDLVIEFPLMEELGILSLLTEKGLTPLEIVPVNGPLLKPIELLHKKDFGEYLMVRAANMKLTVEKKSKRIVNISGGGCPDVPYLAYEMIGKTIDEAPEPRIIGHTLCGFALQLAFERIKKECLP